MTVERPVEERRLLLLVEQVTDEEEAEGGRGAQKRALARIGYTRAALQKLREGGGTSIEKLREIARRVGVPLEFFYDRTVEKPSYKTYKPPEDRGSRPTPPDAYYEYLARYSRPGLSREQLRWLAEMPVSNPHPHTYVAIAEVLLGAHEGDAYETGRFEAGMYHIKDAS